MSSNGVDGTNTLPTPTAGLSFLYNQVGIGAGTFTTDVKQTYAYRLR